MMGNHLKFCVELMHHELCNMTSTLSIGKSNALVEHLTFDNLDTLRLRVRKRKGTCCGGEICDSCCNFLVS